MEKKSTVFKIITLSKTRSLDKPKTGLQSGTSSMRRLRKGISADAVGDVSGIENCG
jgi:hypothetical protein